MRSRWRLISFERAVTSRTGTEHKGMVCVLLTAVVGVCCGRKGIGKVVSVSYRTVRGDACEVCFSRTARPPI